MSGNGAETTLINRKQPILSTNWDFQYSPDLDAEKIFDTKGNSLSVGTGRDHPQLGVFKVTVFNLFCKGDKNTTRLEHSAVRDVSKIAEYGMHGSLRGDERDLYMDMAFARAGHDLGEVNDALTGIFYGDVKYVVKEATAGEKTPLDYFCEMPRIKEARRVAGNIVAE